MHDAVNDTGFLETLSSEERLLLLLNEMLNDLSASDDNWGHTRYYAEEMERLGYDVLGERGVAEIVRALAEQAEQKRLISECPFCGGTAEVNLSPLTGASGYGYVVQCNRCWCKTGYYSTKQESIEAWNRRVPIEQ